MLSDRFALRFSLQLPLFPPCECHCIIPMTQSASQTEVNDRCNDLKKQKRDHGSKRGCSYDRVAQLESLRDMTLANVMDVEQLVKAGRRVHACPYFASRKSLGAAELVIAPYNILLHKGTREAVGIKLQGSILLIDEGHNVLDSIAGLHSVRLSGALLARTHAQLCAYRDRYQARLHPRNLVKVNQLAHVVNLFCNFLRKTAGDRVLTVVEFLHQADFDNMNLFELLDFCAVSKLAQKLSGFSTKYSAGDVEQAGAEGEGRLSESYDLPVPLSACRFYLQI
eukprot:m.777006 g.777006  ORF g.777006 m.777006 type:complete len:281 (+) comp59121_c0_seq22:850-1692(+)